MKTVRGRSLVSCKSWVPLANGLFYATELQQLLPFGVSPPMVSRKAMDDRISTCLRATWGSPVLTSRRFVLTSLAAALIPKDARPRNLRALPAELDTLTDRTVVHANHWATPVGEEHYAVPVQRNRPRHLRSAPSVRLACRRG